MKRHDKPFFSGIIILDGHRIGFLRIHTWHDLDSKKVIDFLEQEISYLQEETEALIIDQTNNGGGDGCLAERVAGFFVGEEVPSILFQLKPIRRRLIQMEGRLSDEEFSEEQRNLIKIHIEKMRRALKEGKDLTSPAPLCNPEGKIFPHKSEKGETIVYTKPKLLLINELSCSAADMFPAILQDIGAVTTFGSRTMGCGGDVADVEFLGYSDFSTRVTESLMVRPKAVIAPNGIRTHYIENVGVIPDIPYKITGEDFRADYEGYRHAIKRALLGLIEIHSKK